MIGHDFCCISLSDLLTPWDVIEKRLKAASEGDFVVAFYNPRSLKRTDQIERAIAILREKGLKVSETTTVSLRPLQTTVTETIGSVSPPNMARWTRQTASPCRAAARSVLIVRWAAASAWAWSNKLAPGASGAQVQDALTRQLAPYGGNIEGLRAFRDALPRVRDNPDDLTARGETLYGAWLCGTVLGTVGMALHHKLCHTLGGSFDLPHAETHSVILPHAVAYNEQAAAQELAPITEIFGGPTPGQALHAFAVRMQAPLALRDLELAWLAHGAVATFAQALRECSDRLFGHLRRVYDLGKRWRAEAQSHRRAGGQPLQPLGARGTGGARHQWRCWSWLHGPGPR